MLSHIKTIKKNKIRLRAEILLTRVHILYNITSNCQFAFLIAIPYAENFRQLIPAWRMGIFLMKGHNMECWDW